MGLLDKVKNLFTEEVEVEPKEEIKKEPEPIQKEVIKVEIPSPKQTRSEMHNFDAELPEPKPEPKEEYKFPFFDDNDFDTIDIKEKEEPKPKKVEIYNPPKEEKKVFKPSPIISPVYGFLDKNYQKEELKKAQNKDYNSKRATVDEIRDKAFGGLESDIETTLFGNNRVLFNEEEKKEMPEIKEEKPIDNHNDDYNESVISEKPRHEKIEKDEDLTDLLEAEMAREDKKPAKKKPRKISDKELFNLIDSMYEGEIK